MTISDDLRKQIDDGTRAGAFDSAPGEIIRADIVGDTICIATWRLDADRKMQMGGDAFSCKREHLPNLIALLRFATQARPS